MEYVYAALLLHKLEKEVTEEELKRTYENFIRDSHYPSKLEKEDCINEEEPNVNYPRPKGRSV